MTERCDDVLARDAVPARSSDRVVLLPSADDGGIVVDGTEACVGDDGDEPASEAVKAGVVKATSDALV